MTDVKADAARARAERRDRLAEAWLLGRHGKDWYIGDATYAEWVEAYDAIDETRQYDGTGGADG